ncbi:MAG: hypothetical protein QM783_05120 [Phycisphaerales bacterium]
MAEVIYDISGPTEDHFRSKEYGVGLAGIGVVLMCRNPELNFKRRIRFSRKEKILYMDVMLDLAQMRESHHNERKQIVFARLIEEVLAVVRKYSISEFDDARFAEDLKEWFVEIGEPPVSR